METPLEALFGGDLGHLDGLLGPSPDLLTYRACRRPSPARCPGSRLTTARRRSRYGPKASTEVMHPAMCPAEGTGPAHRSDRVRLSLMACSVHLWVGGSEASGDRAKCPRTTARRGKGPRRGLAIPSALALPPSITPQISRVVGGQIGHRRQQRGIAPRTIRSLILVDEKDGIVGKGASWKCRHRHR